MSVVAIVQARVGSTRLPGKVLADLAGRPMLLRVLDRAGQARRVDQVVVATSVAAADDAIEGLCRREGIGCFRGSEDDVLARYAGAADAFAAGTVVRITADCPLLDPAVVDAVIDAFLAAKADYASNIAPPTFPDGLDTEVLSREALERAHREARLRSEREHVTLYIRNHPELFRSVNVASPEDLSHWRWTVDEPADLELAREIYRRLGSGPFGLAEVREILTAAPEIALANRAIARNEGLAKSLREDRPVR
jgi:spore coat polysaccharide biosynthesis protein SpsF (cytidylyltransferase family)